MLGCPDEQAVKARTRKNKINIFLLGYPLVFFYLLIDEFKFFWDRDVNEGAIFF